MTDSEKDKILDVAIKLAALSFFEKSSGNNNAGDWAESQSKELIGLVVRSEYEKVYEGMAKVP